LNVRDGNYWAISSKYHSLKKGDEDWEDNNHSIWLVVKSFKSANSPKVIDTLSKEKAEITNSILAWLQIGGGRSYETWKNQIQSQGAQRLRIRC